MMDKVFIADHPLIQHKVTLLRSEKTGSKEFRELIKEITELLCYEATQSASRHPKQRHLSLLSASCGRAERR